MRTPSRPTPGAAGGSCCGRYTGHRLSVLLGNTWSSELWMADLQNIVRYITMYVWKHGQARAKIIHSYVIHNTCKVSSEFFTSNIIQVSREHNNSPKILKSLPFLPAGAMDSDHTEGLLSIRTVMEAEAECGCCS